MGLGNNRDYTTAGRNIRRNFAVVKARVDELAAADPTMNRYSKEGVDSTTNGVLTELGGFSRWRQPQAFAAALQGVLKKQDEEAQRRYGAQAMQEFRDGKLKDQLRAWVDPILAHRRAMRLKNRG